MTDRPPLLFADRHLARRIEAAECQMITDAAEMTRRRGTDDVLIRPIGGGVAVFTSPGAPWNKMTGVGFANFEEATLEDIEREFDRRSAPLQVELSILADNTLGSLLTKRGYVLSGFENVLGLGLEGSRLLHATPGLTIDQLTGSAESMTWISTVVEGFGHPDEPNSLAPHESFSRQALEQVFVDFADTSGFRRYLSRVDGSPAGGASLRVSGGVAQLCGAATLPAYRRRGVQTALLRARLHDAAVEGCDIAVVTTQPGSTSQSNVQRQGFALLYTRAILIRQPVSLTEPAPRVHDEHPRRSPP